MTAGCNNLEMEFSQANIVDQRLKTRFFKIIDAFAVTSGKFTRGATGS